MDTPPQQEDAVLVDGLPVPPTLGRLGTPTRGPSLVVFGGLHGNEPAGIRALRRVLAELAPREGRMRGQLVALAGNRAALARGVRFLARDLNRRWTPEGVARLRALPERERSAEDREQARILDTLEPLMAHAADPITFLDLHSMSGPGAPFACMSDTLRNRTVAFALPVPVILGLEEVIDGSMLGYFSDLGHRGVAVEGGQHDAPQTVDNHVAAVWIALVATGILREEDVPELAAARARLREATRGIPRAVGIRYRHVVTPEDTFEMLPGFTNFDPVREGQVVARDQHGPVRAPMSGRLLLPRYQGQGEDGFFVGRALPRAWFLLSRWVRRLGAEDLLVRLPGVRPDPEDPDRLRVPRDRLDGPVLRLLHLGGYRRRRQDGEDLVFSRRRPDRLL